MNDNGLQVPMEKYIALYEDFLRLRLRAEDIVHAPPEKMEERREKLKKTLNDIRR